MRKLHKGFAVVELMLVLVIVGILGFVAWRVVQQSQPDTTVPESVVIEDSVPAIEESKDLDTLAAELDATDFEGSTVVDLESETVF